MTEAIPTLVVFAMLALMAAKALPIVRTRVQGKPELAVQGEPPEEVAADALSTHGRGLGRAVDDHQEGVRAGPPAQRAGDVGEQLAHPGGVDLRTIGLRQSTSNAISF